MNILFVLYGDFSCNSANPLVLYARELSLRGHRCAVAVPSNLETVSLHDHSSFLPFLYSDVLARPSAVFPDGRPADVIHACTPREVVRQFIVSYMAEQPTPLVLYLEDNESWISCQSLGLDEVTLFRYTTLEISEMMTSDIAHPFYCDSFIGMADAVVVIQDKLMSMVPSWVPSKSIMIGVDLDFFYPRNPDPSLRKKYGVGDSEKIIVYHGGLNDFTRPAVRTLCEAIGLINQQGCRCRLLRTGPFPIDFLGSLSNQVTPFISDLGVLAKHDLPDLLALADVCVQPGKKDSFEDLRLPGKIPEWLAMGLPVVMPDANIAHLFTDGENVTLLHNGSPEEIAEKCIKLFSHPQKARNIGRAGRLLAEQYFNVRDQAKKLEEVYKSACVYYSSDESAEFWQRPGDHCSFEMRLALKLRSLARSENPSLKADSGGLLVEYAKLTERTQQRIIGLEARLTHEQRGGGHIVKSIRRIIGEPIRFLFKHLTFLFGQHEFQGGLRLVMRKLRKVYLREGWAGIRFRLHRKIFGSGVVKVSEETTKKEFFVDRNNYQEWIRLYDTLGDKEQWSFQAQLEALSYRPKISVVLPVHNPPLEFLEQAIQSVRNQLYPEWELCIADDASENEMVRELINRQADEDERIRVVFRSVHGHISQASNSAIDLVTGDWIAFLDHDDLLPSHALAYIAEAINANPQAGLFYSDEDKVDSEGRRYAPYFKPDWNPELFFSHNMICHLSVYRKELIEKVGKLRLGYEGAQDYDLALRCIEHLKPEEIIHVPRVLYHWRRHEGSTALTAEAKPYAMAVGEKALNAHLTRQGIKAKCELVGQGFRIRYALPDVPPRVTLIILVHNGVDSIKTCIESIFSQTLYGNYEILLVNHQVHYLSELQEYVEKFPDRQIRVLHNSPPSNFSALNNSAVMQATGQYIGFLDSSVEVLCPHWLKELVSIASQPLVGAVGAKLLSLNETIQSGGVILGIKGEVGHAHKGWPRNSSGYMGRLAYASNFSAVNGACLIVEKTLFQSLNGFDEEHFKCSCYDIDLCLRLNEIGRRNIWTPNAELYLRSTGKLLGFEAGDQIQRVMSEEMDILKKRWKEWWLRDPAYNPNLTLDHEDFSLAWPPRMPTHSLKNNLCFNDA